MFRRRSKIRAFPPTTKPRSDREIADMYAQGYVGCDLAPIWVTDSLHQAIADSPGGVVSADDACRINRIEETGKGKLSINFPAVEKLYPGSMPGAGQDWGDCVSHGAKNAVLCTMCCEIVAAKPDEVTGKLEQAPEVPAAGIADGVLSPESIFWFRRHGGDGWFCEEASEVMLNECGAVLRKPYPELNLDLTVYSLANSKKYGRTPPTGDIAELCKQKLVRTATIIKSWESFRDLTANGYGVNTCGSEGFSERRDTNGVSKRQGTWHHSMATFGADDRPIAHSTYGCGLVLVAQSWGPGWGGGGRRIMDTNIDIPPGFFWCEWTDWSRRWQCAYSGHNGWPQQSLPNWGWNF